jgi:predicted protein tyrosine phosphatase
MPDLPRHLLFICSQNRWRSLTAERLFDDHPEITARSAGTEPGARVRRCCVCDGEKHVDRLQAKFKDELRGKPLVNLRIPDDYTFQDVALVELLRERLRGYFGTDILHGA